MTQSDNYIELGGSSKPHGIKGAFVFHLYNSEDSVLKKGSKILLLPNEGSKIPEDGEEYEISSIAFGNKVIVGLKGVVDRNKVEDMLPFTINFKKEDLPEPKEDEFYLEDLVGLKVINEANGKDVGRISTYYDNTAQLVLVIRGEKDFEIPYIENFVKELDIEAGTIRVIIPQMIGGEEDE